MPLQLKIKGLSINFNWNIIVAITHIIIHIWTKPENRVLIRFSLFPVLSNIRLSNTEQNRTRFIRFTLLKQNMTRIKIINLYKCNLSIRQAYTVKSKYSSFNFPNILLEKWAKLSRCLTSAWELFIEFVSLFSSASRSCAWSLRSLTSWEGTIDPKLFLNWYKKRAKLI